MSDWWKDSPIDTFHNHHVNFATRTIWLALDDSGEGHEVGPKTAEKVFKNLDMLCQVSLAPIEIVMCCPGGDTITGIACYEVIRACEALVTITVLGEASSMGAVILQAADTRQMYPTGVLMLHDGSGSVSGHIRDLERGAEEDKRRREQMYQMFADRTGQDKAFFRRKCAHDWYLTPEQALELNLIDKIL